MENELQRTDQTKFRIEKVMRKKQLNMREVEGTR